MPGRNSAFTLLEVVVVLVIIGVMTGAAALSLSGPSDRRLREEVDLLRETLQAASDEAIVRNAELGVAFTRTGYLLLRLRGDGWQSYEQHALPHGTILTLAVEKSAVPLQDAAPAPLRPAILLLSSGEMTPFILTLTREGQSPYTLATDGLSRIAMRTGNEP